MKKAILFLLISSVQGCATIDQPYDPVYAQCDYEASIATGAIQNPIAQGLQKGQLIRQCLIIRGR